MQKSKVADSAKQAKAGGSAATPVVAPAPAPTVTVVEIAAAFLTPPQIFKAAENIGVAKANLPVIKMFGLGFLSGAFIGLGNMAGITFSQGMPNYDKGVVKFANGLVTPIGLVLVLLFGSELIMGNFCLLILPLLNRRIHLWQVLLNWTVVYLGNLYGAIFVAYYLGYLTDLYTKDPWLSGLQSLAETKVNEGWGALVLTGIGCNWLVNLSVFMNIASKTIGCKILAIWFPIETLVTIGYDHCIANMCIVPMGIMYGANVDFGTFIWKNLIPVTIGNGLGAGVFVSMFAWWGFGMPPYELPADKEPAQKTTDSLEMDTIIVVESGPAQSPNVDKRS